MSDFKTPPLSGIASGSAELLTAFGNSSGGIEAAKRLSKEGVTNEKETKKAADGFEALLLQQMLQAMWSTVDSTGLMGEDSNEAQIYRDMLNQAVADNAAKGSGIGVKKVLMKELNRKANSAKPPQQDLASEE